MVTAKELKLLSDNWVEEKLIVIEKELNKLEEEYEKRKKIESCGEYEKKGGE